MWLLCDCYVIAMWLRSLNPLKLPLPRATSGGWKAGEPLLFEIASPSSNLNCSGAKQQSNNPHTRAPRCTTRRSPFHSITLDPTPHHPKRSYPIPKPIPSRSFQTRSNLSPAGLVLCGSCLFIYAEVASSAAYYILYTTHTILHTTYYILHTPYYILHTTYYTHHTTYYILHTTYYIPHTTYYMLHTTHYILHTTYYMLHTTYYIPHTTYHTLYTTYYILHTTYKPLLVRCCKFSFTLAFSDRVQIRCKPAWSVHLYTGARRGPLADAKGAMQKAFDLRRWERGPFHASYKKVCNRIQKVAGTTYYILHTTHYILHTTHYTLHTTYYTLHTTYYTLHTTYCMLPV